jgi:hypothetical protein
LLPRLWLWKLLRTELLLRAELLLRTELLLRAELLLRTELLLRAGLLQHLLQAALLLERPDRSPVRHVPQQGLWLLLRTELLL